MKLHSNKEIIHREFELERVILFSDAVFAIAITLLIIDIKFPDVSEQTPLSEYWHFFKPTIRHFLALCISFFFIGMFWSRHLSLFRYLIDYDRGIIFRNLFFLFFIVIFPFAAEAIAGHMRPSFLLPFFIYIGNIFFCSLMHLWLCHYIFYGKPSLCIPGQDAEKKYTWLRSKWVVIIIGTTLGVTVLLSILFPSNTMVILMGFYCMPVLALISRKVLKKYKPVSKLHPE